MPGAAQNYSFLANLYVLGRPPSIRLWLKGHRCRREAAAEEPNGADILYQLAVAYAANGRFDEAAEAAQSAAGLDPNWPDPVILLADIAREQGRFEDAREGYSQALAMPRTATKVDPGRLRRVREALASIEASLSAQP